MRLFVSVLLVSLMAPALASADDFRCFGLYSERNNSADLLFYGDTLTKEVRMEFVGDNGFFSQSQLVITDLTYTASQELSFNSLGQDGAADFSLRTVYNPSVGNYTGEVVLTRANETATYPARCVVLRGI